MGTLFLILLHASFALAGGQNEFRFHQLQQQSLARMRTLNMALDQATTAQGTFDQKLDPTDPGDTRTFRQRYFVNSTFATSADAPVFYVMCGEGACEYGGFLGFSMELARRFHARLVALEHRYYGPSQPFSQLTPENLKHLTTENALADLARFQAYLTSQNGWTGKWIAIGGSYSGTLAAYYRLQYPQNVIGALASSAPVEAKAAFDDYDRHVTSVTGPQCAEAIRGVVAQVEASFADPESLAAMKRKFGGEAIKNRVDFIYTLADMAAIAVQYGKKDEFCSALLNGPDPVAAYAKKGQEMFSWFGISPLEDSFQGAESTDASRYSGGVGIRQWIWQTCTEFGFFQVAHADPSKSVRSSLINLGFHFDMCRQLFGLGKDLDTQPKNQTYYFPLVGGKDARASHVFFTNGAQDPWQFLSISRERGNDSNPRLNYRTIADASHCDDLGTSSAAPVKAAREEFVNLINHWLAESSSSQ